MKLHHFAIILLLFSVQLANAQVVPNWLEGYIVMVNGDTIHGPLKTFNEAASCDRIVMKKQDTKIDYSEDLVIAYQRGEEIFVKNNIPLSFFKKERPTRFLALVSEGKVGLYKYYINSFYQNINVVTAEYFLLKEGSYTKVNQLGFRKFMMEYFSDDEDLVQQLKKRKLKYFHLEMIVKVYNKYD